MNFYWSHNSLFEQWLRSMIFFSFSQVFCLLEGYTRFCTFIAGIPTLIILDENNDIITTNGRALLTKDPDGKVRLPPSLLPGLPLSLPPQSPTWSPSQSPTQSPPYLPPSLPPVVPASLPPGLPLSLPTSLPPSLPTGVPLVAHPVSHPVFHLASCPDLPPSIPFGPQPQSPT